MLKRKFRLQTDHEFRLVRKYGQSLPGKYFYVSVLAPRNYQGNTNVSVVVSTKFHKRAVKRNRIKRVLYEIIRLNFAKIPSGLWVVINPKLSALDQHYEELNLEFIKILQRIPITR